MQLSDKTRQIIAAVAPGLATALGGPLAGAAAASLSKVLLGKPEATPDEINIAVQGADPNKIVEAQRDLQLAVIAAGLRTDEIALEDRKATMADVQSARQMAITTGANFTQTLALCLVAGWFTVELAILFMAYEGIKLDAIWAGIIGSVHNQIGNAVMLAFAFFYGTSANSRAKDETISAIAQQKNTDK